MKTPLIAAIALLAALFLTGQAEARQKTTGDTATVVVPVYYVTDRQVEQKDKPDSPFGYANTRNPALFPKLDYGVVNVAIQVPASDLDKIAPEEVDALSTQLQWSLAPDPKADDLRFKRISSDTSDNSKAFFQQLSAIKDHGKVVYIHGYNTNFETAAHDAAQVGFHARQPVILYSWPSHGGVLAPHRASFLARTGCALCLTYAWDMNNIIWSSPHFESFLRELALKFGPQNLKLVAHSMGNQLLFNGLVARAEGAPIKHTKDELELARLGADHPSMVDQYLERLKMFPVSALKSLVATEKQTLMHLVSDFEQYKALSRFQVVALIAPDVDLSTFEYSFPKFLANSEKTYIFLNETDKALALSEKLNNGHRLGRDLLPHLEKLFPTFHTIDYAEVARGKELHHLDWDIVTSIICTGAAPGGYKLEKLSDSTERIVRE